MKVLIVDDNAADRKVLRYYLEARDAMVLEAENGAVGLDVAEREHPDLIISDALMPEVDGFQLLRQISSSPALRRTPFIFYSAVYTGAEDRELALSLGANAFIVKPKEPEEFWEEVKQALDNTANMLRSKREQVIEEETSFLQKYSTILAKKVGQKVGELAISDERFRDMVEKSPDWFWEFDRDANFTYVSPRIRELLGYEPEEILGHNAFDLMPAEEAERVHRYFDPIAKKYQSFFGLVNVNLHKDGREVVIESSGTPIFSSDSEFQGYRGIDRDVTERNRAEVERQELETKLRQKYKMEAVGVMAGGIAHNFNNNLAIILGSLEMAKSKISKDNAISNYLGNAKIATLRSRDLILQILSYSRQGRNCATPVTLAPIFDETMELLRVTIPSTVTLQQQIVAESGQVHICADASKIQEVLINLCNNAVQAMDEEGELRILLETVELKQQDIPACYDRKPGHYVKLSIQDTGSGMSNETLEKIFDPFFTTKEVGVGTGMGLATVQGIVEQHGGIIKVNSVIGQGSSFELYFPIIGTPDPVTALLTENKMPRGDERILLVDDDEMQAELGERLISELGYQVTAMTSSVEALDFFTANPNHFDLIVSDQTMPGLTGKELIKKLLEIRPDLRSILCTGYSSKALPGNANELGINAFMMKPFEQSEFAQTVRRILDEVKD